MDLLRIVRVWQRGSVVIGMGLFCSFLTCLAGTLLNVLLDRHDYALDPSELMRRLIIGYAGSAAVVVLAFPFLARGPRRQESGDGA
ncbi:hypothetical protein A6V36_13770 [Paraburkholderia ginsengiterrae]|uniref:Uncharacterized protein n=1 Tax=Paraburkholderia ginsengiterrae TaxID=1462993 RepID=A0A1A9MZH9_9BURK|nr:hypothetical protein [Paraburkholderia ginsengiterrae]OAJ52476.1 hypothetical protein A6V36_13770 [Paraburkholderia ginsengiterrae]OAJ52649.1 hypothetical protein A6V37_09435 [Paraburkholderia ginsengiterrae]